MSDDNATQGKPRRRFTDEILSDEQAAILRRKTPTERLQMALASWTFIRDLIHRTARAQHPEWSDAELNAHVAQRMSRSTG
jgi:hypothetical protein